MILVVCRPIHRREYRDLLLEYDRRRHVHDCGAGGRIYQHIGDQFAEFVYLPEWHYEYALDRYQDLATQSAAAEIMDAVRDDLERMQDMLDADAESTVAEYQDSERNGHSDR